MNKSKIELAWSYLVSLYPNPADLARRLEVSENSVRAWVRKGGPERVWTRDRVITVAIAEAEDMMRLQCAVERHQQG